jgi:hypothetical protein
MEGPGRAHGFVVTTAMIIALIGLLTTIGAAAIPALIGLQSDTIKYEHEEAMAVTQRPSTRTQPLVSSVIRPVSRTGISMSIPLANLGAGGTKTPTPKKEDAGAVVLPVGIGALAYLLL